jgi:hypothetical protein
MWNIFTHVYERIIYNYAFAYAEVIFHMCEYIGDGLPKMKYSTEVVSFCLGIMHIVTYVLVISVPMILISLGLVGILGILVYFIALWLIMFIITQKKQNPQFFLTYVFFPLVILLLATTTISLGTDVKYLLSVLNNNNIIGRSNATDPQITVTMTPVSDLKEHTLRLSNASKFTNGVRPRLIWLYTDAMDQKSEMLRDLNSALYRTNYFKKIMQTDNMVRGDKLQTYNAMSNLITTLKKENFLNKNFLPLDTNAKNYTVAQFVIDSDDEDFLKFFRSKNLQYIEDLKARSLVLPDLTEFDVLDDHKWDVQGYKFWNLKQLKDLQLLKEMNAWETGIIFDNTSKPEILINQDVKELIKNEFLQTIFPSIKVSDDERKIFVFQNNISNFSNILNAIVFQESELKPIENIFYKINQTNFIRQGITHITRTYQDILDLTMRRISEKTNYSKYFMNKNTQNLAYWFNMRNNNYIYNINDIKFAKFNLSDYLTKLNLKEYPYITINRSKINKINNLSYLTNNMNTLYNNSPYINKYLMGLLDNPKFNIYRNRYHLLTEIKDYETMDQITNFTTMLNKTHTINKLLNEKGIDNYRTLTNLKTLNESYWVFDGLNNNTSINSLLFNKRFMFKNFIFKHKTLPLDQLYLLLIESPYELKETTNEFKIRRSFDLRLAQLRGILRIISYNNFLDDKLIIPSLASNEKVNIFKIFYNDLKYNYINNVILNHKVININNHVIILNILHYENKLLMLTSYEQAGLFVNFFNWVYTNLLNFFTYLFYDNDYNPKPESKNNIENTQINNNTENEALLQAGYLNTLETIINKRGAINSNYDYDSERNRIMQIINDKPRHTASQYISDLKEIMIADYANYDFAYLNDEDRSAVDPKWSRLLKDVSLYCDNHRVSTKVKNYIQSEILTKSYYKLTEIHETNAKETAKKLLDYLKIDKNINKNTFTTNIILQRYLGIEPIIEHITFKISPVSKSYILRELIRANNPLFYENQFLIKELTLDLNDAQIKPLYTILYYTLFKEMEQEEIFDRISSLCKENIKVTNSLQALRDIYAIVAGQYHPSIIQFHSANSNFQLVNFQIDRYLEWNGFSIKEGHLLRKLGIKVPRPALRALEILSFESPEIVDPRNVLITQNLLNDLIINNDVINQAALAQQQKLKLIYPAYSNLLENPTPFKNTRLTDIVKICKIWNMRRMYEEKGFTQEVVEILYKNFVRYGRINGISKEDRLMLKNMIVDHMYLKYADNYKEQIKRYNKFVREYNDVRTILNTNKDLDDLTKKNMKIYLIKLGSKIKEIKKSC